MHCRNHVPVSLLPVSRLTLTSLSNKRNLEGPIFGWVAVYGPWYAEDLMTRTDMSQTNQG